jgi:hypothetical protein
VTIFDDNYPATQVISQDFSDRTSHWSAGLACPNDPNMLKLPQVIDLSRDAQPIRLTDQEAAHGCRRIGCLEGSA